MEPAGTGGGGPHREYPIRLLSFPLRVGLWVGFGLRLCHVCFPSREQEIRRPPAGLVFGSFFKNSIFNTTILAILYYFHNFGNLSPDQSF
jgi:hypothetical protein